MIRRILLLFVWLFFANQSFVLASSENLLSYQYGYSHEVLTEIDDDYDAALNDQSRYLYSVAVLEEKTQAESFFALIGDSLVTKSLARVPGRVQSRINVSNSGIDHVLKTHLNPARTGNKSQFTLPESELRSLLSAKSTVQSPVRALETGNFARTVTANRTVGNLADKMGGGSTNTFTVISDKFGNLQSAFPGGL